MDWSSNEGHRPLEVRSPGAFFCSSLTQVQNLLPRVAALEKLAMQPRLDRCSPENESLFSPASLANASLASVSS